MFVRHRLPAAAGRLVPACLLFAVAAAAAQPAVPLEPVVVDVRREPQPLPQVVADVVVIDAERIRDSAADSLEDLLRREAGVQLSRNGGPGQVAGPLLRGSSSASTVVLVDGVRIGSATSGQTDLSVLSLAQVERIEVLRGPGSSLYGADAVGGVVRITTRRGRGAPAVAARAAAGGLHSRLADASVAGRQGAIDYAATLARESSDGVSAVRAADPVNFNPDRDGFERDSVDLRLGFAPVAGQRIGLALQRHAIDGRYDAADFAPPDFVPDPTPDFRRRDRAALASLDWRADWSPRHASQVLAAEQRDRTRSGAALEFRFDTTRRSLSLQHAFRPDATQQWLVALDHVEERIDSSDYAAPERDNTGLVLAWSGGFGAQRWQLDLRHDDNSVYGGQSTGKFGWSLVPAEDWTLRVAAGNAFRAPSFNDLYYPFYGSVSLEPERATSVEAGVEWAAGGDRVALVAYRQRVRNLIGFDPGCGCAGNVARARLQGATLDLRRRSGAFAWQATLDWLDAVDADTGARLPRRAARQGTAGVDWAEGPWSASATLVGVGARPDGGVRLRAYETLDLSLRWRAAPRWRVETQLRNALDRDVEPARFYRAPGRQAWVGLRYDSTGF